MAIEKPAEHSYSKNYSDRDSEMDEFDNIIKSLQKLSSDDESVIVLSGEDTPMRQEKSETEKTITETEITKTETEKTQTETEKTQTETEKTQTETEKSKTEIVPRQGYSHSPSIERTLDEKK